MTTAVLDLELEKLPPAITGLDHYNSALVLIRLRGRPVARVELPVIDGRINHTELCDAIVSVKGWSLWEKTLRDYLNWDEVVVPERPPAAATVAVCTRDRPEDIKRCLEALLALPDDGQELLVIDNCPSTDDTQKIVGSYGERVRYVREDRPGLNVARNRALQVARHEIVAFIDDDAVADFNWLRALLRNFDHSLVMAVTGLTMPLELETEAQELFERYSTFCRGFEWKVFEQKRHNPLTAGQVGAGVNMALRRSVLELVGPFDEALDAGTPTQAGGETEMFSRIMTAGYRIVYEPDALNWHRHRRTREALRQTFYGYGVGIYAVWTQKLLFEKEFSVLLLALNWFYLYHLPMLLRSLVRLPGGMPLDLIVAEIRGCLAGPSAYLRSRRQLRAATATGS